ncbi:metallothiol transferase FosB [Culicoidibacter larvae]|uniref:Metallothiol transferase FosB n=1 Tax=Culicoidibacter larvae TaxID=2579976 RepID=A0A5R8QCH1_9FIRM|nr:metallothiol transferase FosB [Culicoidibacter larvae]TLG74202.1 metallothiol transferase FosB [Culicoidibacter larvae]
MIKGINHITFSVANLERSIDFYQKTLGASLVAQGERLAYFDLAGVWLALNLETEVTRSNSSYSHIAFSITQEDIPEFLSRLQQAEVTIEPGRSRNIAEADSIYFRDPDGHLLEVHCGSLQQRLEFYLQNRSDIVVFTK